MSKERNIISVSGGKDSTALLLLALERRTENMEAVFADTGHEHPMTYEYVEYLNEKVFPIRKIRADFTEGFARRRAFMERVIAGEHKERVNARHLWTPEAARAALEVLHTTGNPFLDMCLIHGRFPSTRVRFCSEELKRDPITKQVHEPILEMGDDIISWQGVRADESPSRALLPENELKLIHENGSEFWNYRPIKDWTVEQVFEMHARHGVEPNPLYKLGMGRVGCMPCIHAKKDELLEISRRFPEEVQRVVRMEALVQQASKTGTATFFSMDKTGHQDGRTALDAVPERFGVEQVIKWAQTGKGGKTFDMFRQQGEHESGALCTSIYGLCE